MKTLGALMLTLSCITPAVSVFVTAPGVVHQAGTGAFLSYTFAAIIGFFTAYVYAELSSAFPLTGGEYAIVGRVLGPFAGFVILGVNLITLLLTIAVVALGIGNYIGVLFPHVDKVTAGIAVVAITTLFGVLHIRTNAIITGVFLLIEMSTLVALSMLGFEHVSRPLSDFIGHPVALNSAGAMVPASIATIGHATSVAIFSYNGYGQAVYLGEEIHDAPRRIVRVILWALVITIVAEAVPVTAMLLGAPDLNALFASENMLSDFLLARGGERLNLFISLGVAAAIMNANIAVILMVARQFYSTGRDRVWPQFINYALTRIHGRFHSPWVATLVCGALAAAACFIRMNTLLVIVGTSLVVVYASLCVSVIVGRRQGTTAHGQYKMPLYPAAPVLALVALGYVLYANFLDEAIGRPSLLATLGMIVVSSLYYFLVLRRRGDWELRGPMD